MNPLTPLYQFDYTPARSFVRGTAHKRVQVSMSFNMGDSAASDQGDVRQRIDERAERLGTDSLILRYHSGRSSNRASRNRNGDKKTDLAAVY